MSDLLDLILDTSPGNNDIGVPLKTTITLLLSGLDYDEDSLKDGLFVEGPDTDQFVGPDLKILSFPDNISQNDLDDFLQSPGYQGIVKGTITVAPQGGNTLVSFASELPLYPHLLYVVNLTSVKTVALVDIDGFVSFSFETGTGSIEVIPDTVSTSILNSNLPESALFPILSTDELRIVSVSPLDRSVQNSKDLKEIVVTFNKDLDEDSIDAATVLVTTSSVTNHPSAITQSLGQLAKSIEVVGKNLIIRI